MLDAIKYIDRLRQTVKDVKSLRNDGRGVSFDAETRLNYLLNRCRDIVKDYDRDFNFALQEEEDEGTRRGRETAEYIKKLTDKKDV